MDIILQQIKLLPSKVIWNYYPEKLTCVIVEPRKHPNLRGCLYNMANIYANTEVGLTIFYSSINIEYIKEIIQHWKGVQLIKLIKPTLTRKEYSYLLTRPSFYEVIKSSYLLVFQTDSIIFKPIPDLYFEYDYVGAPWPTNYIWGNGCGNGGFSLRKKTSMIQACHNIHLNVYSGYHPEDIYFSYKELHIPPMKYRQQFSVEYVYYPNPIGCHKVFYSEFFIHILPQIS